MPKILEDGKSVSQRLCTKCGKDCRQREIDEGTGEEIGGGYADYKPPRKVLKLEQGRVDQEMSDILGKLRERAKRTILRKLETGEITFNRAKKAFFYVDTEEEYKMQENTDGDSDDDGNDDDDDSDE